MGIDRRHTRGNTQPKKNVCDLQGQLNQSPAPEAILSMEVKLETGKTHVTKKKKTYTHVDAGLLLPP